MSITLRPNQVKPVEIGIEFFKKENPDPAIIVLPTAWGKSILVAKIAESIQDNILILQPSKELLDQNYKKYLAIGGKASIYSASFKSKEIGQVTFATIGSIKNVGVKFKELGFNKLCVDEIHQYPRGMESMLGKFLEESGIKLVLGTTATPLKLQQNFDKQGNRISKLSMLTSRSKYGQFFKDILYVAQTSEMVELGFWSKLIYEEHKYSTAKLKFNSTKSDYTEESVEAAYEENKTDARILERIKQLTDRKSIIVFVPSIENAKYLAERTENAVAVYSEMKSKDRDKVVEDFKNMKIRVVYNVNIFSTGFDHPQLDCIICGRPTASLSFHYQSLGRGSRIHPNKKDCLIIDYSGNVKKFGKIEELKYVKENVWKLYGEGGKLLTGIPVHEIGFHVKDLSKVVMGFGKYKDQEIKDIPKGYRDWMLSSFTWNEYTMYVKEELERLAELEKNVVK